MERDDILSAREINRYVMVSFWSQEKMEKGTSKTFALCKGNWWNSGKLFSKIKTESLIWFDLMCLFLVAKITATFWICFFVRKPWYLNTFHYLSKPGWSKNNTGVFIMVIHSVQRGTEINLSKNSTFKHFSNWILNSRTNLTLIYSS